MKQLLKHVGVFVFFVAITFVYFSPKLDGRVIQQGDIQKWEGMSQELKKYYEEEGGTSVWTGSMFSGMPSYTVSVYSDMVTGVSLPDKVFRFLGTNDCGPVVLSMFAMYVLLIILGAPLPLAVLGAVGFAYSSYSFIILQAGHVTKAWAMAYMPLVVAGVALIFKNKWLSGFLLFAISLSLEISHNHIQITYYLAFFCLALFLGYLLKAYRDKEKKNLMISMGAMALAVVLAVLVNSARLYSDLELGKTSIRGKSELTAAVDGKEDKSSGLDQDYAFAWSYGVSETLTVLIPNFNGGASGGEVDAKNSNLAKAMKDNGIQVPKKLQTYTYWGDQPFTSGPVYFGAIICFLFVLSLFVVKSSYKWWVVGATVFFVVLSWGRNFPALNDFFFHYLPMYNKFRTPSMALVIPQLSFVLLGCMALKTILQGDYEAQSVKKHLYISAGVTGGLCLVFALVPGLFLNFTAAADASAGLPDWYMQALLADRHDLLTSDAWRSFFFIALAAAAVFYMVQSRGEKKSLYAISLIALLTLVDLWAVDRRYLNEDDFVSKSRKNSFVKTEADRAILKDKDPSYRVLTLNNPFNDTNVSYFHKSIGGYNAAKLRRYQELIDMGISPEMSKVVAALRTVTTQKEAETIFENTPVLNMLNMRYLIYNEKAEPIFNPNAFGNAWFVDEVKMARDADEEMSLLLASDPKRTALVDVRFKDLVSERSSLADSTATAELLSYKPDEVKYSTKSAKDGVLLFSEVYYQPGWHAYLDGEPADHFRANWILRGMVVPAGNHEIRFEFYPDTYWALRWVGLVASWLLLLGAGYLVFLYFRPKSSGAAAENK